MQIAPTIAGSIILCTVGIVSKLFLSLFCRVRIRGDRAHFELFKQLVKNRAGKKALLTISNHLCPLDDPVLWGVLPWSTLLSPSLIRWTLGSGPILFNSPASGWFFRKGRVIPTWPGRGLKQEGMVFAEHLLREGEWLHIFPEAVMNRKPGHIMPFKWGLAELLLNADRGNLPVLFPVMHDGMQHVLRPDQRWKFLGLFRQIDVHFSAPIEYAAEMERLRSKHQGNELRASLTVFLFEESEKRFAQMMQESDKFKQGALIDSEKNQ